MDKIKVKVKDNEIFIDASCETASKGNTSSEIIEETLVVEPERYFHLPVWLAFDHAKEGRLLPKAILENIGRVRKGATWEQFGFIPYGTKTTYSSGDESRTLDGSIALDGQDWWFQSMDLELGQNKKNAIRAIREEKRLVTVNTEAYILKLLDIPYSETIGVSEEYIAYANARLALEYKDFVLAIQHAACAIKLNPREDKYKTILFDARVGGGDLSAIEERLDYYKNDMDSAAHCGNAEKCIRVSIDAINDFRLALRIATSVIYGIDQLIEGRIDPKKRIYGRQSKSHYINSRIKFIKRLGTLKGFLGKELATQNLDQKDVVLRLIDEIQLIDPSKAKKNEPIRSILNTVA